MNPIKDVVIQTCTFETPEEFIGCPYYEWRLSPFKCNWKALSNECLSDAAKKYWNKRGD
jgi:hypothetical protein